MTANLAPAWIFWLKKRSAYVGVRIIAGTIPTGGKKKCTVKPTEQTKVLQSVSVAIQIPVTNRYESYSGEFSRVPSDLASASTAAVSFA